MRGSIQTCEGCSSEYKVGKNCLGLYCSLKCQMDHRYTKYVNGWFWGIETGYTGKTLQLSSNIKRYFRERFGTACWSCGWDKKHPTDGAQLTEFDHIDGDAANCSFDNIRILCPNCHSMTPTFRARNPNSSRKR